MFLLPSELLEKVFAQLPRRDLVSVALTSRLCYHLSLTFLYRTIRDIQLSGRNDQDDPPSLKCLDTISSPRNASQTVRHLAVRGHPWLQESTMNLLLRALFQVKDLISLELELGSYPEERILTESQCSDASFLPRLQAFSVHRHTSAVHLLKNRPVENARIRSHLDFATFLELLPPLRRHATSLTSLQVSTLVRDVVSAVSIMDHLAREFPTLRTLGITFTFPTPHWTERLTMVIDEVIKPLTRMRNITEIGLAFIPDLQYTRNANPDPDLETIFDVIRQHIPQLQFVEVQWEARELRGDSLERLPSYYPLMRRMWRYTYANRP